MTLNKVHNTVNYIYSQEKAGHNCINEKRAIKDIICIKLNKLFGKLERIKYLIKIHLTINLYIVNSEKWLWLIKYE